MSSVGPICRLQLIVKYWEFVTSFFKIRLKKILLVDITNF